MAEKRTMRSNSVTEDTPSDQKMSAAKFEDALTPIGFMPDVCSSGPVLAIVLIGELVALMLTLANGGFAGFSWSRFGLLSFLVIWIMLCGAATFCGFRQQVNRLPLAIAASVCFAIVLLYSLFFSIAAMIFVDRSIDALTILSNLVITAIVAGILLRYLYLQQQLQQREQAELRARVQALQSRIRPHFLFNSLNSIASLISIKPESAETMVVHLAQLFRASLKLPELTTLKEELILCRRFIAIEKQRLGERLAVIWHVDSVDDRSLILNLLLQPLLENAIYHGVQPLPEGGAVKIELLESKGDIVLKVTNPLLPGEAGHRHVVGAEESQGHGIAIGNIRGRLAAFYGDKAYLRRVKDAREYTVIVRFPKQLEASV